MSELEEHYELVHSFQCSVCRTQFLFAKALRIHLEEEHSVFFKTRHELRPEEPVFLCWHPDCPLGFVAGAERDAHSLGVHQLAEPRAVEQRRKLAPASERPGTSQSPAVPSFGGDQERTFLGDRPKLQAARRLPRL